MVAAAQRNRPKIDEKKPYDKPKTLKENPIPIITPALNQKKQEDNMEIVREESSQQNNSTEKLEILEPSIISRPDLDKTKRMIKKTKEIEIRELAKEIDLPSTNTITNPKKAKGKRIKMIQDEESYSISTDLLQQKPCITFAQLLDASPKLRMELSKGLKLETPGLQEIITSIENKNIALVKGEVEGKNGIIFIDSGASINVITQKFLDSLPKKEVIGYTEEVIKQVINEIQVNSEIVNLTIKLNNYIIKDKFRVLDSESETFDVLIGFDTMVNNHLFIHPLEKTLCRMISTNEWEKISDLSTNDIQESSITNHVKLFLCSISKTKLEKETTIEDILGNIPLEARESAEELFKKNKEILATSMDDLKSSKLMEHRIQLKKDTVPIKQRTYRLSRTQMQVLKEEIQKLINKGLIEPSSSAWSSPVILVPKKNGKWRMCVDYRKLNEYTIKDSYALPYIDEILFSVGRKIQYFSTIDLFSGYHQISMAIEDRDKTCFTTMFGNYNFKVMPFGLCNAPATFQREMNRIFFPLIGKCMFVYLDDLVIFSRNLQQHFQDLSTVFHIIKENELRINIEKCSFFKDEVEILGHVLSRKGLHPIDTKIQTIRGWISPTNITELRSFLGAVGYYRKFIVNFSQTAKPLFKLLKKNEKFKWTEIQEESFKELKFKLISAPILQIPDFNKTFIIRTDASTEGLGGVLLQKGEDQIEHPICFVSRTLTKAENNYGITDLEGTAAYYCCKKFRPFILGNKTKTTLYTDHKPLLGLFNNKEPNNSRQARWIVYFSTLQVTVKYEPGKRNNLADALSRIKVSKEIINTLKAQTNHNFSIQQFIKDSFVKIDGELYYKDKDELRKVIDTKEERFNLIIEAHHVGHEGVGKTYERLRKKFFWKNMIRDVQLVVKTCHKCQLFRPKPLNLYNESYRTKPDKPFTTVGLDIIGPLPETKKGNKFIIVLVDYFTKWVEAEAIRKTESSDVINFLINVFARHGIPEILITDNGPQFTSDKTKGFLDLYGVFVRYSTTYHPETNGEVENRNKEIGKYLRLLSQEMNDWDEVLPNALWALRTCKNSVTQFSSFELLYGRKDLQPFELMYKLEGEQSKEDEKENLINRFVRHAKWIKEATKNIQKANKLWEERRVQAKRMKKRYKKGDLILIRIINRKKLDPFYYGPLRVVKSEMNTLTVCDPITGEIADRNVHLKNVVPYYAIPITTSRDEVEA